ncbi:MAG: EMC3/TMCO1 family protein [Nanoarchaeota archaeon]
MENEKKENKKGEGGFGLIIFILLISMIIAGLWDKVPAIKNSVHYTLNPSAGFLLNWNLNIGMLIVVFVITILTTIVQKYATDQKALKELKKEQKEISQQMKEFKNHPEKLLELQKKQFKLIPKQMKLSMRAIAYTGIPFILFFRWFGDYFLVLEETAGQPVRFWLGMSWFIFYLLFAIVFGAILRKWWDVV